jgi:hypothetical protein
MKKLPRSDVDAFPSGSTSAYCGDRCQTAYGKCKTQSKFSGHHILSSSHIFSSSSSHSPSSTSPSGSPSVSSHGPSGSKSNTFSHASSHEISSILSIKHSSNSIPSNSHEGRSTGFSGVSSSSTSSPVESSTATVSRSTSSSTSTTQRVLSSSFSISPASTGNLQSSNPNSFTPSSTSTNATVSATSTSVISSMVSSSNSYLIVSSSASSTTHSYLSISSVTTSASSASSLVVSNSSSLGTSASITSSTTTTSSTTSLIPQTSTPTGCPNFSTSDPLIGFADSTFQNGFYGSLDSGGNIETASNIGIWLDGYNYTLPDIILDISNPPVFQMVFETGTNIILDGNLGQLTVSDCNISATLLLPISNMPAKRNFLPHTENISIGRRQATNTSAIDITVTLLDACGQVDTNSVAPPIYCRDVTPASYIHPDVSSALTVTVSPGVYETTCVFTDTSIISTTFLSCTILLPALQLLCEANSLINSVQGSAEALCSPLILSPALELYPICVGMLTAVDAYCEVQQAFNINDKLQTALCSPLPETDLQVTLGPPWAPLAVLGQESSDSPQSVSYTLNEAGLSGASCGACSAGYQLITGPWEMVYSGPLTLNNFDNPNCGAIYNGPQDASQGVVSFSTLLAYCEGIAESQSIIRAFSIMQKSI